MTENHSRMLFVLAVLAPGLLPLAACSHVEAGLPPANFGNAVDHNVGAQLVNPDGPTGDEELALEGNRAALGQDRYQSDNVEQPRQLSTAGGAIGGGGAPPGGGAAAGQ